MPQCQFCQSELPSNARYCCKCGKPNAEPTVGAWGLLHLDMKHDDVVSLLGDPISIEDDADEYGNAKIWRYPNGEVRIDEGGKVYDFLKKPSP